MPYYVADDATEDEMAELFFSYPNHSDWLMMSTLTDILPDLAQAVPSFRDIIYGDAIPLFFEHKGINLDNYMDYEFPGLEEPGYYADLAHGNMAVFLLNPEDLYGT